ncbi:phenylalanine--tRNA ligase subunit alpha [Patescibacteria group bacterium]
MANLHPITQFMRLSLDFFQKNGFEIIDTPEIETEYYNFDSLNVPSTHPSRDTQDTFWLKNNKVLRTHTTSAQVREMEKRKPPVRIVVPGRCFRNERTDAGHETTFFQLDGFVIDKDIKINHLLTLTDDFAKHIFGKDIKTRIRPHFYPFVEPGFDIDINCLICAGKGCSVCKKSGWLEVMPCGMIHPIVFKNMSIDPEMWSGFAFGFGIDRLMMLYYGIDDIRLSYKNDLRFLKQFK